MGAGKTTIGRLLAKHLGKTFYDTDHEIEKRTGVKIPIIFELEGEAGFRKREAAVIEELTQLDNIVMATGGGAVITEDNRNLLQAGGTVIYLRANVNELWHRMRNDKHRPLLQNVDIRAKLEQLYAERNPLYMQTATLIFDTGHQPVTNILCQIEESLTQLHNKSFKIKPMMQTLNVALGDRTYPIHIGSGLITQADLILPHLKRKNVAIVTNTTVAPLYLNKLAQPLRDAGVSVIEIILPDGEAYKNSETLNLIYDALLKNRCERSTTLIALGGGVIGDLTGYAAATYLRGVPFIQIPTTLLSQVDSSVGGKTGINHPLGKNMIGAFYQPKLVLADIDTLQTLPKRELSAGIAEVIKYGLIRDAEFFDWLELNMSKLMGLDEAVTSYAIYRSCQNKAEVVAADEHEMGERALLNLGHTFGHAIENAMGYGVWLHGEAVAAGTMLAADLSQRMGWLNEVEVKRIHALLSASSLPLKAPHLGVERYLDLMQSDKKVEYGKIRLVLQQGIGKAVITSDYDAAKLNETLASC